MKVAVRATRTMSNPSESNDNFTIFIQMCPFSGESRRTASDSNGALHSAIKAFFQPLLARIRPLITKCGTNKLPPKRYLHRTMQAWKTRIPCLLNQPSWTKNQTPFRDLCRSSTYDGRGKNVIIEQVFGDVIPRMFFLSFYTQENSKLEIGELKVCLLQIKDDIWFSADLGRFISLNIPRIKRFTIS